MITVGTLKAENVQVSQAQGKRFVERPNPELRSWSFDSERLKSLPECVCLWFVVDCHMCTDWICLSLLFLEFFYTPLNFMYVCRIYNYNTYTWGPALSFFLVTLMLCGEILSMEHQRMHSAWPLSISGARHKIGSAMTHAETKLSWIRSGQLTKLAWQHKTIQAMKSLKHQWLYYAHKKSGATATRAAVFCFGFGGFFNLQWAKVIQSWVKQVSSQGGQPSRLGATWVIVPLPL